MSKAEQEAEKILFDYQFCDASLPFNDGIMTDKLAVICAIIHVEGIINELKKLIGFYEDNGMIDSDLSCQPIAHWQEVLTILKNK